MIGFFLSVTLVGFVLFFTAELQPSTETLYLITIACWWIGAAGASLAGARRR